MNQHWRTSTGIVAFLWSLGFRKDLVKPRSLDVLLIKGKKEGHHAHSQPMCNRWCYPIGQMTISMEPEGKTSGDFPRIDDSLGRICIHDPLHFNRGNTMETLSPPTQNLIGINSASSGVSSYIAPCNWGASPHLIHKCYQIQRPWQSLKTYMKTFFSRQHISCQIELFQMTWIYTRHCNSKHQTRKNDVQERSIHFLERDGRVQSQ